ncbi:MAG: NAD-dependent malic enzyme [Burkholderiales bacterium]|jgi:malate dehydrogenase (oxaloacetate-decarboxylating)|nr:NAD-dependent malic enzyme [Burkholderiales bacterium]
MRFELKFDKDNQVYLASKAYGYDLLNNSRWNKSTSFTQEERDDFSLNGLLPPYVFTLDEVVEKRYMTMVAKQGDLEKHIYLRAIQDRNETLFYALIDKHIEEIMPLVYTPVVGLACQEFSHIYRQPRGVFVSYPNRDKIDAMLSSPYFDNVQVIVVSDGERILGLGDQGAGGMGIPIGKLSLYTACAGIAPEKTLPILLDVGTDNPDRLKDPLYIGWRNPRIRGQEYDDFVDMFVKAVKKRFPHVLLQWEDFAQANAGKLLNRHRQEICSFNDDIQGTAAITVSALIAAIKSSGIKLQDLKAVVVGAGSAGIGISNLLVDYLEYTGISRKAAQEQIFLVDRYGLITENIDSLDFQHEYVKSNEHIARWKIKDKQNITLLETVANAKANLIIGVSAQGGIFTQAVIAQMALNTPHPIVFPLSNPTTKAEAAPQDVLDWTAGNAIIGTGTAFPLANRNGKMTRIDQVNNCYIFPGIGLGILAVKATIVTDKMFLIAAIALAELSPATTDPTNNLLPPLNEIRNISKHIALRVAKEAIDSGVSQIKPESDQALLQLIESNIWEPKYIPYKRVGHE